MNQQGSEDSHVTPLLLEIVAGYIRANPSQAQKKELHELLVASGVSPDLTGQLLSESSYIFRQPDPQPTTNVEEQPPSILLYGGLLSFAFLLVFLGFIIQSEDWAGLVLNLATEIIGAVLIFIVIDRRLRDNEVKAIRGYVESSSNRFISTIVPDLAKSDSYARSLRFELKRIRPRPYIEREEHQFLLSEHYRYILIHGSGGCGKSTLLQNIALHQAEKIKKNPKSQLPVILPMRGWENSTLETELWQTFNKFSSIGEKKFHRRIQRRGIIAILDAIDECKEVERAMTEIRMFQRRYPYVQVIASCRTSFLPNVDPSLEFKPIELPGLSKVKAMEFLRAFQDRS